MAELVWPVNKCENPKCGFDLTTREAKPKDKSFSEDGKGRPMWSDFCPKCGMGYIVGEREIPGQRPIGSLSQLSKPSPPPTAAEFFQATAKVEKEPEPEPEVVFVNEVKPVAAELVYVIPKETELEKSAEVPTHDYFCTKCNQVHKPDSDIGREHADFAPIAKVKEKAV